MIYTTEIVFKQSPFLWQYVPVESGYKSKYNRGRCLILKETKRK